MELTNCRSLRAARRKVLRLMHQCLSSTRRLNKRYNDGHSSAEVRIKLSKLRSKHINFFSPLVGTKL